MIVSRNAYRLVAIVYGCIVIYISAPYLYRFGDHVRQTNPFSGQKWIEQAFVPTEAELACLNGQSSSFEHHHNHHTTDDSEPIPNIVHFNYGLKNPLYNPGAGHFDFLSYLAVRSAIVSLKPDAVYLHYTYLSEPPSPDPNADPLTNPWIRRLSKDITLIHHPPTSSSDHYAHVSDTLRLKALLTDGGIYLDIDAFALRPFDHILANPSPHDVILGAEGGNRWGLCNAVIAARPNSTFLTRWLESYNNTDLSKEWNYHSVILPKELAEEHPSEVCALAPDAFFWPTWTWRHIDWMHERLDKEKAKYWEGEIERHGGSLFTNQLAYHAWSQMAWERYLRELTPEVVRGRDTRFNLLMRRFLEDDL
ncbi:uncharacterized protein PODANS_4_7850 [Podospora anserina S mat+]|uniref:Glycosyltransferase n=2 Tax=Podospora TaxID=5144 RepID=B2ARD6_PODAN|nr:uncharacterized protein PODANS_4_7850 [Podospora anserina S mat+]CAP66714.1 unnamed protein product [Podospora anserina S mat+]CDP28449.1 Putative Glycosyltransferase [Podospora anserina S mat+]VBB80068.1 Putative Glycosyltransferase [Podospora comata]